MAEPGMMNADVDTFLEKIAKIESNSGANFGHKKIKSGPQKGQTAIGTYGLLPNTVDEILTRSKDPALDHLSAMTADEQKAYLESHPEEERRLAEYLAGHVLAKQGGDQEKAAYSWLHGHNLSPEKVEKRDYQSSYYVKRFNKIADKLNPNRSKKAVAPEPSLGVPEELMPTTMPPFDIGGTSQGDKVQNYMEASPTVQADDLKSTLEVASRSPFTETPAANPNQFKPANIGPFNKIKTYLAPKVPQPTIEELMANQPKNPELLETLRKIRGN